MSNSFQFKCDFCDASFTLKYNLTAHLNSKHSNDLSRYNCPDTKCDVTCTTKYSLVTHVRKVHPKRRNFTLKTAEKQYNPIKGICFNCSNQI